MYTQGFSSARDRAILSSPLRGGFNASRRSLLLGCAGGHGDVIVDIGDQLVVKLVQRHIRDIQSDDSLGF